MKGIAVESRIRGGQRSFTRGGDAEKMKDKKQLITIPEIAPASSGGGRHKGSFKRMLLRQIKQARSRRD
jgi:hypothetical protein